MNIEEELREHLKLLELPESVNRADIKLQYYQLLKRYHPDTCRVFNTEMANKKTQEIIKSYEFICKNWRPLNSEIKSSDPRPTRIETQKSKLPQTLTAESEWFRPLWSGYQKFELMELARRILLWCFGITVCSLIIHATNKTLSGFDHLLIVIAGFAWGFECLKPVNDDPAFSPKGYRMFYRLASNKIRAVLIACTASYLIKQWVLKT